ncbi:TlpA family protein disulfide reductase [Geofilum rubicundum]|uniref:Thioredoxin n=1 Tax=Geofilum rubicundum JCM 15548 TaxID=1236989 RepID=A0A0E9LYU3_9BACT|nr:TlpA disulfide reductase family protein [Geofilum rubicundum]GAO30035.1 thioredoxin [Geofilum rubicundum JCM 15548]
MIKIRLRERWEKYKRTKRWWSILLDFLFLVLIVAMLIPEARKSMSAFVVRHTMLSPRESSKTIFLDEEDWRMSLMSYSGDLVELSEMKGRPVFINYWATWCPPCIAEMPSLQNLYNEYKDDVHFVFISNEDPEVVRRFMESRAYDLPLYTVVGRVTEPFETSTLPTTILIGSGGRMVLYKTGAARWDSKKVFSMMDELIAP